MNFFLGLWIQISNFHALDGNHARPTNQGQPPTDFFIQIAPFISIKNRYDIFATMGFFSGLFFGSTFPIRSIYEAPPSQTTDGYILTLLLNRIT